MLSAWAEGNSVATEALGHLRTVKAFASEPLEKKLYREANAEALRLGIKDSIGFGLTSALTGYLDLGAGVLILWYGGKLVLDGDESGGGQVMTIGKLVTFQLYW
jgi:ATP-binding cassette subfamily B protein